MSSRFLWKPPNVPCPEPLAIPQPGSECCQDSRQCHWVSLEPLSAFLLLPQEAEEAPFWQMGQLGCRWHSVGLSGQEEQAPPDLFPQALQLGSVESARQALWSVGDWMAPRKGPPPARLQSPRIYIEFPLPSLFCLHLCCVP